MTVAYSLADGNATIALDRPEVRNALNFEMCEALLAATKRGRTKMPAWCSCAATGRSSAAAQT